MRRVLSMVAAATAALALTAPPASADDNPDWHGKCSTRVSPTEVNNAEGWVNAQADGNNWKIVNIYANLRNVGGKITGDHQIVVKVFNGPGGSMVTSHTFTNIANSDIPQTADVYPAVSIPKGRVGVQIVVATNLNSWPKNCSGAGLLF
ncbi:hypothetical protein ACFWIW_04105 [Amycolatopsis sp. NPDC058340]|uniref:hypothetical protein n=1 Tax=Amycolatopsis sp. NPDC058340 TaxID=3346453 RepID=UPI0036671B32